MGVLRGKKLYERKSRGKHCQNKSKRIGTAKDDSHGQERSRLWRKSAARVLAQPTTILVGFRRHVKWLLAFALGQERGRIPR